ncbi:MAG TPA: DUF3352 domain-containing protein [Pyrinomonadaceae bacterium]|nr:DUF3352 domain-containing protein [Pyrinomonadaceae bacterium]
MRNFSGSKRFISLAIALAFLSSPLIAQQRRSTTPRKSAAQSPKPKPAPPPAPTFDTLLATDKYRIYSEVRGVGQLLRSPALTDLLDPVMKLGGPPKEFKTLLKWLNAQADTLAGSRMLVAGWPSQPNLPAVLLAIEFNSPEEAQKFDPKLRGFVPTLLATPTPTPSSAVPGDSSGPATVGPPSTTPSPVSGPALPPYVIKQAGSLILISDKPFAFRDLAPRNSKLLSEDQSFATIRNRFASESLFVFVDLNGIEKEQEEQRKKYEELQKKHELEAANSPTPEEPLIDHEAEMAIAAQPSPTPDEIYPREPPMQNPTTDPDATLGVGDAPPQPQGPNFPMFSISSLLFGFGGQTKWAEAVGVAVAFEGDSYVLRALIVNGPDSKTNSIPFVPQFISGPALVPAAPNVFPSNTDFFVTLSLDYPQIYDRMLQSLIEMDEMAKNFGGRPASAPAPESPFAIYEKQLGLTFKNDLLPLLGNELAIGLLPIPKQPEAVAGASPEPSAELTTGKIKEKTPPIPDPVPVVAISLKDRDAVRRLLPKIIESFGFKGASLIAQTEKRGDTEIVSYGGAFAYAFVEDFLVVSADPVATRQAVDSYLDHQTLSSDSHFRNSTRWQPRQLMGQLYVAPDLVERYFPIAMWGTQGNERMREFLSRLSPVLDPVSYSLTDDGLGPLHELHVPRNMVMLFVAGLAKDAGESETVSNESVGRSLLRTVYAAEATFQSTQDDGRYGTLEELKAAGLLEHGLPQSGAYKIELRVSGNKFEATAVPVEYGKTGFLSFFIDESGILRGGDKAGGSATVADNPIQ